MKTKNKYIYPIKDSDIARITYDESPAHVGPLEYSVDFICDRGTEVLAAQDGIVVEVKIDSDIGGPGQEFEELGNWIEIKHENEEYTEYEHLSKGGSTVEVGDVVKKGQLIGYSGATGWMAHLGPHLHFMIGKYDNYPNDYQTLEIVWENE